MKTIIDICADKDIRQDYREELEREYEAAKAREDWAACSAAVEKMRALGKV